MEEEANMAADARACTGVLAIHPMSRDIKLDNFSVTFHGAELLQGSANSLKSNRVKQESELCYSLRPMLINLPIMGRGRIMNLRATCILDFRSSGLIDCSTPSLT